jgi:CelD/BcsL family acetyltransferase involved in cellulose biosynthesis
MHGSVAAVAPDWDALANRVGAPPFLRPGWFAAFTAAFGLARLEVRAARRNGRLASVAPLDCTGGVLQSHELAPPRVLRSCVRTRRPSAYSQTRFASGADVALRWGFSILGIETTRRAGTSARRRRHRLIARTLEQPPYIAVDRGWEAYESGVDAKARRDLRRRRRLLDAEGAASFEVLDGTTPVDELLEEGFAVEASGWKGDRGTAIASHPVELQSRDLERITKAVRAWRPSTS